jgi:ABC-2 type transport system ATP-binding protein
LEYVIETKNLSKYFGEVKALHPIELKVPKNSIFGFLGPNGAGKTTLMKMLMGLTKPTQGSCTMFGNDMVKNSVQIRSKIGYLPQEVKFYGHMTVRGLLEFSFRFYVTGPKNEMNERIDKILELVGLSNKEHRTISNLSGGEKQRLGLAQAQVHFPELLILDEPAAALDPIGRKDILDIMKELQKETTIFYSTHILDDVQKISDSVAILNEGRLISQGPIEDLLKNSEGLVYVIEIKGDSKNSLVRISDLPWVSNISTVSKNDSIVLNITVSDEGMAEKNLQREILKDENLSIVSFNNSTLKN